MSADLPESSVRNLNPNQNVHGIYPSAPPPYSGELVSEPIHSCTVTVHSNPPFRDGHFYEGHPSDPPPYSEALMEQPIMTQTEVRQGRVHETVTTPVIFCIDSMVIINNPQVGKKPTAVVCKSCLRHITTDIDKEMSSRTCMMSCILLLLGCWPCICVPCMVNCYPNIKHYCPHCQAHIGTYRSDN